MNILNPKIKELTEKLQVFKASNIPENSVGPFIRRGNFTGAMASFYEKVRYLVDYKDEHTIRRSAIERIIRRKVIVEDNLNSAHSVLEELVNGGYLPDNVVPESLDVHLQEIINRALRLRKSLANKLPVGSKLNRLPFTLASGEIDAFLFPTRAEAVLETFFQTVKEKVFLPEDLPIGAREMKIYIACRRAFLKDDDSSLIYALWLKIFPNWRELQTTEEIEVVASKIDTIDYVIRTHLCDPLTLQLASKLKNKSIYFSLIKEIVDAYGTEVGKALEKKELVENFARRFLSKRYFSDRQKQYRKGLRAVSYIFLTKIIFALALEVPYDFYMYNELQYTSLVINAIFHPILLFLIISFAIPLGERNTLMAIKGLNETIYGVDSKIIQIKKQKGKLFFIPIFSLMYLIFFFFTFYLIYQVLDMLDFSPVSMILFVLFLTLVSYFGLHIKNSANGWKIRTGEDNFLQTLWGLFVMPITQTGRFLSLKFDSVNIFVLIMDFIIEAPFMLLIKTFDSFIQFIRDKREEIY